MSTWNIAALTSLLCATLAGLACSDPAAGDDAGFADAASDAAVIDDAPRSDASSPSADAAVGWPGCGVAVRASEPANGRDGNGRSGWASAVSGDGRFIAFNSDASNLVPGDVNDAWDIFVKDIVTGELEVVSIASNGTRSNGDSGLGTAGEPISISADGRYVAFSSWATNLVPDDTNDAIDVFVYDRDDDMIERVSVSTAGAQGDVGAYWPSLNADGRYVAFTSFDTNLVPNDINDSGDVLLRDRVANTTTLISSTPAGDVANGPSGAAEMSGDGNVVSFASVATDLVVGVSSSSPKVYARDLLAGATELVSVSTSGTPAQVSQRSAVSYDGRYVAFDSQSPAAPGDGDGVEDIYIRDRNDGTTTLASVATSGAAANDSSGAVYPGISADGRYSVFTTTGALDPSDENATSDIYVFDLNAGTTTLVTVAPGGGAAGGILPEITADGKYVVFESALNTYAVSDSNGLEDVFLLPRFCP